MFFVYIVAILASRPLANFFRVAGNYEVESLIFDLWILLEYKKK